MVPCQAPCGGSVENRFAAQAGLKSHAGVKEREADQGASEVEQPLQDVSAPLVADAEPAAAEQPSEAAVDDPAVPSQPLTRIDALPRNPSDDAACPKGTPEFCGVVHHQAHR
jgi:hypothetical protein